MPALDLIRPSVTAMRVIASVNAEFARELKLPPHIRSLGLISADSDDVTYIAADEATKQAMVEVVYGRSLYAGAAHGPSPTAGEVLIMLGGPNPAEVRAGLDAMVANIENGAAFQWANDAENTAFLAHVVSRTGSYLSSTAGITLGDPMAYLVAPPLEATYGIDAAKYVRPDVSHFEAKKLRRGDYSPELFLDLHGLTQLQAKQELGALIAACRREHVFCACVMHGHGKHILKQQTPLWLAQHPHVMAFHQAPKSMVVMRLCWC